MLDDLRKITTSDTYNELQRMQHAEYDALMRAAECILEELEQMQTWASNEEKLAGKCISCDMNCVGSY